MKTQYALRNRVKELRARLRLRQADLAREVQVTRQTILAIEKGRLNPSITLSLKIARVLREPVDYIFFLDHADDDRPLSGNRNELRRNEGERPDHRALYDFG